MKLKSFYKSVAVLLSGTAFAQLINIAILPIITRLYTPDELGLLALFSSTTAIFLTIVCLRLETSIPVQDKRIKAIEVLTLCIVMSFLSSLTLFAIAVFLFLFIENVSIYILFIPLGLLAGGLYLAFNSYAVREKQFGLISRTRVGQSSISAVAQVLGGLIGGGPFYLILGYVLNLGAGFVYLKKRLVRGAWLYKKANFKTLSKTLNGNINFPKFSVVESLLNTAGIQLPIMLIAYSIGYADAGFIFLAMKIIQAPMALLGMSISQVFYSQSQEMNEKQKLGAFTTDVVVSIIKIGVGPILFISLVSEVIIYKVLGEEWAKVGYYILIMSPWFVFQFLASPISPVMYVKQRQKSFMWLTMLGFFIKLSTIGGAIYIDRFVIEALVVSNMLFYVLCFGAFLRVARVELKALCMGFIKNIYIPVFWVLSALILRYLMITVGNQS